MANPEHLKILKQGVKVWNQWRKNNPQIKPDLREAKLSNADLHWADLRNTDLRRADLHWTNIHWADLRGSNLRRTVLYGANLSLADLREADLSGAKLIRADLSEANFSGAKLIEAELSEADLSGANLNRANLSGADLRGANFNGAILKWANLNRTNLEMTNFVETSLEGTNISNCRIYGMSVWNLKTNQETKQFNLVITQYNEPVISVDNLEVAQFVYLLLCNEKIRNVIDTIGEKGVLILGRFTEERKAVLDAIRERLRELGFVPMMFDFEKPTQRDFTETIKTLAGLSRFIIADITNPKSSPLELQATMPDYMIPFVPIIQEDEEPFSMFRDLQQKYGDWVLDVLRYDSADNLLEVLEEAVVKPALKKADKLLMKKAEGIRDRHVKDYM